MVNRRDLELFRADVPRAPRHPLQSAGRVGNVEQIIPMLCSSTLDVNQHGSFTSMAYGIVIRTWI